MPKLSSSSIFIPKKVHNVFAKILSKKVWNLLCESNLYREGSQTVLYIRHQFGNILTPGAGQKGKKAGATSECVPYLKYNLRPALGMPDWLIHWLMPAINLNWMNAINNLYDFPSGNSNSNFKYRLYKTSRFAYLTAMKSDLAAKHHK